MSDQRKRHLDDDQGEESDEEYTPDETGSGSGESESESDGKKPRAPARQVSLLF